MKVTFPVPEAQRQWWQWMSREGLEANLRFVLGPSCFFPQDTKEQLAHQMEAALRSGDHARWIA